MKSRPFPTQPRAGLRGDTVLYYVHPGGDDSAARVVHMQLQARMPPNSKKATERLRVLNDEGVYESGVAFNMRQWKAMSTVLGPAGPRLHTGLTTHGDWCYTRAAMPAARDPSTAIGCYDSEEYDWKGRSPASQNKSVVHARLKMPTGPSMYWPKAQLPEGMVCDMEGDD